ncbi:DUF998 domain-containing protein [Amycolatopsis australiensis]|uniref:DUF998 domain-containing protein n=1 Tax=Amycolatopsis australiensis TaxID=546364 RepID=A0A1K1SN25_9PSEU|nr:DUF998 domain-containing protein [Amycolatopsis australiensis]SFW85721.1 Protein of unknown function [Amycolatopsis australiensis]
MTPQVSPATVTLTLALAAQAIIAGLTVGLAGHVDPWRDPVSDYAWHRGGRWLFTLAVLLLLAAAAALVVAARVAGLPRSAAATVLFGLWVAGLVVVLVFPGNVSAANPTVPGEVHRAGGAVLFTSLPLAALALSARLRTEARWVAAGAALRRGATAGMATAAAFGAAQVVAELPAGLLERLALLAEFAIIATTATAARRQSDDRPRGRRRPHREGRPMTAPPITPTAARRAVR